MLSGIGPADELRATASRVTADLPGVGANLQDHLDLLLQYRCLQPVSFDPATVPLGRLTLGLELAAARTPAASAPPTSGRPAVSSRSRPEASYRNLQHHFAPVAINYDGSGGNRRPRLPGPYQPDAPTQPRLRPNCAPPTRLPAAHPFQPSGGGCRGTARNPRRPPHHPRLIAQQAFDRYRGEEIMPGADVTSEPPRRLRPGRGRDLAPPELYVPHGPRRDGGRRWRRPGPRHEAAAGDRRLDHAELS